MSDFPTWSSPPEKERRCKRAEASILENMLQAELELGSLLYRSGATGGRISDSVRMLHNALGGDRVCVDVGVEVLSITVEMHGERLQDTVEYDPPTSLNATVLCNVSHYLRHLPEKVDAAQVRRDIEALDQRPARPGLREFTAMIAFMIIFGYLAHADLWSLPIIAISVLAAILVREALTKAGFGYFIPILGGTIASTVLAALLTMLLPTTTALIAMVVPCIILMPGFQLINGGWEVFRHHLQIGIPRIVAWLSVLSMLTLGLLMVLMFYAPAQETVDYGLPLLDKLIFFTILGGVIVFCFCVMVGAPKQAFLLCILCGAVARLVRTAIVETGGDVSLGTFAATLSLAVIAVVFCLKRLPEVPVVLPLVAASIQFIPSYYAILSLQGMSQIIRLGASVPFPIMATTIYNGLLALFIVAAIVIGTTLPLLAVDRRRKWY